MPAFVVRLVAVLLVVLVAACGGDAPEPEPAAAADPPPDATTVESLPRAEPLGDRFEVCGEVQAVWDALGNALPPYEAALSAVRDAERVVESATDDLDRAEANEALSEDLRVLHEARSRYESAIGAATGDLFRAMSRHAASDGSPETIIYARGWDAFIDSADASTLAALAGVESAVAALEAATNAVAAAENAYDETHGRALVEAEAAVDAAQAAHEAAQQAYAAENDVHISEAWMVVFPEEEDAWAVASAHHSAVRNEETSELVALRETIRDRKTTRSDAVAALTAAEEARGSAMTHNAVTGTPAYLAFRQSFQESCR